MARSWDIVQSPWPEWQIGELLGEGAFGRVYEVHREKEGRVLHAAMKMLKIPADHSELYTLRANGMNSTQIDQYFQQSAKRMRNEIILMEELQTAANIVSIHDSVIVKQGANDGYQLFIRMELLTNLDQYCYGKPEGEKQVTVAEVIKLGGDICNALAACEKKNIIHRDIKPSNIFVSDTGDFKLGDFGVSRQKDHTNSNLSSQGTVNYMAPEVYREEHNYDATVDLYSLGLVLYKMLNWGRFPFVRQDGDIPTSEENTIAQQKRMKGEEPFPDPVLGGAKLADILRKACSFRAADRYQSAEEMRNALFACRYSMSQEELDQEIIKQDPNGERTGRGFDDDEASKTEVLHVDPSERSTIMPERDDDFVASLEEDTGVNSRNSLNNRPGWIWSRNGE